MLYFIMILSSKSERDVIGIDNFERAIVYSALLLRKGLRLAELPTNQIVIYQNLVQGNEGKIVNLTVECKLPIDSSSFLGLGGNFLNSILAFSEANITYDGDAITPTVNNQGVIPDEPTEVNSLEKYLAWSLSEWVKFNKAKNETNWDSYGYFSFLEEANPPVFSGKVILKFDYANYINTKNLIAAVIPSISFTSVDTDYSSLVGNNILFGNDYLVGN